MDSKKTTDTKKKERKKKTPRQTPGWVMDVRYGRSLSVEFFRKNAWLLMIIVISMISLMGLRYKTKTKMEEIKRLTNELQLAESSKLQEKAAYMSLIREIEMRRLVEENHLGLQFQEQPPYLLTVDSPKKQ